MKKILVLLVFVALIVGSVSAATLTAFRYYAFTLDRSVSPQLIAPVESVHVVIYRDNGTTAIDSGYTAANGYWSTNLLYRPQSSTYQRVLISKTGYASEWTRFHVGAVDTAADSNWVVPLRVRSNVGDSTYVLSFTLVNADGSPATGVSCYAKVHAPFVATGGNLFRPSGETGNSTGTSDAGGLVELDILSNAFYELYIAGQLTFPTSVMDSTKDIGNVVLYPK